MAFRDFYAIQRRVCGKRSAGEKAVTFGGFRRTLFSIRREYSRPLNFPNHANFPNHVFSFERTTTCHGAEASKGRLHHLGLAGLC